MSGTPSWSADTITDDVYRAHIKWQPTQHLELSRFAERHEHPRVWTIASRYGPSSSG
jgi:hypothetical protein